MYPLEFKVTSTLHCFPATVKGALEKQAEHVLNESELLAVRGAIHVHAFCLLSFSLCLSFSLSLSLSHTHTHTLTHTEPESLASLWAINNVCAALHPPQGQETVWGEGTCVTPGPWWGHVCSQQVGGRLRVCAQSCPTLCGPMHCSSPAFSVRGIFQARILEWVTISHSRASSRSRDRTLVSSIWIGRCVLNHWTTWEVVGQDSLCEMAVSLLR